MSETIHWETLSEKDKVQLLIEHVFHYRIDDTSQGSNEQPFSFWDSNDGRWQLNDGEDTISFDPLHLIEDAWQIVEEMNAGNFTLERIVTPPVEQQVSYARYSDKPLFYEAAFYLGAKLHHAQADTPHEAICIAALRAVGVEVLTDEPLQG
jgi:hypothetical protein